MQFIATELEGAYVIQPPFHEDNRGLFARTYCAHEFGERGLVNSFVQCNTSWNARKGTVRGLHYQLPPSSEVKLVRCTAGALLDVIVDLRPGSPTYLQHVGVELTARNRLAIYSRNVRPWVPDSAGGHRGLLPDERILRAETRQEDFVTTIRSWASSGLCQSPRYPVKT
jgi:hypothetical protein